MPIPTFKLSDGNSIPAIAFGTGTWYHYDDDTINKEAIDIIASAIKLGVKHIDGAEVYNTDNETGLAIQKSGAKRSDLFITDKNFIGTRDFDDRRSKEATPYDALKASLVRYKLDYVDLYLLHSQHIKKETHGFTLLEAWKSLEKLKDDGLAKSIGVSNFDVLALKEILDSKPKHKPVVNQIEFSPQLQNQSSGIVEYCNQHGILVEGYAPLAPLRNKSEDNSLLNEYLTKLALTYKKTEEQILLRWVLHNKVLPVTGSTNLKRIESYSEVFDFNLRNEEVDKITELGSKTKLQIYAAFAHYP